MFSIYICSNKSKNYLILKILTEDKVKFLIDILIDSSQFNYSNNYPINIEQIKNNIKFKYTICSILINLLYDTDKLNEIFNSKIMSLYNFILTLIQIYQNWNDVSFLILITHYQWLLNNLILGDENYPKIINQNPNINFPQLIQNIFSINNPELYLNNIRMLVVYLKQQSNKETLFQYNSFISNLDNIISNSIEKNDISIILEAYEALNELFKSEANCKYVIENKQYINLITKIVNGFNNISYCNCCLTKLIKNDHDNIINDNYQIFKTLLDIIFKKIPAGKDTIKH